MFENATFNTPQNTQNYGNFGNQYSNIFSALAGKAGNWIDKNPERFAIMADAIGQNIVPAGPGNPLGGIGTAMAKSSLADKARQKTDSKYDIIKKLITGLSSKEMPGGNSLSFTTDANGNPVMKFESNLGDLDGDGNIDDAHSYLSGIAVQAPNDNTRLAIRGLGGR